jgi:hypothetical protein
MRNDSVFGLGGDFAGYDGEDFIFKDWSELWRAVTTNGHPLAQHASRILSARRYVRPMLFQSIRVSCDAVPPIVEVKYPRWFGWGIVIGFGLALWAGVLFLTVR